MEAIRAASLIKRVVQVESKASLKAGGPSPLVQRIKTNSRVTKTLWRDSTIYAREITA